MSANSCCRVNIGPNQVGLDAYSESAKPGDEAPLCEAQSAFVFYHKKLTLWTFVEVLTVDEVFKQFEGRVIFEPVCALKRISNLFTARFVPHELRWIQFSEDSFG